MAGKPEASVFQIHNGPGNNFAGDSFDLRGSLIHIGLMPEMLGEAMRVILDDIAGFRLDDARKKLAGLQPVSFGVQDSDDLITVLANLCDVVDGRHENIDSQRLRRIAGDAISNDIADLALSVQLRLQVRRDDAAGAIERYSVAPRRGAHSRAIYFECLCGDEQELLDVFTAEKYTLTRPELTGIATGLLRFSNGGQAAEVAGFIHAEDAADYNGTVLSLLAQATQINSRIATRCYWLLPQSDKDAVVKLINDTLALSEMTGGRDRRMFNILLPVFDYVQGDAPALEEFCLDHIEMIDSLNAEFAGRLRAFSGAETPRGAAGSAHKHHEASLPNHDQIAEEDFFRLMRSGQIDELREWIGSGGRVHRCPETLTDAVFCVIECIFSAQASPETMKILVDRLSSRDDFADLNPHFAHVLAKEMLVLDRPFEAAMLLEKIVGGAPEVWCSPLMDTLCEALYNASQHRRLERFAAIISPPDRTPLFYRINVDSCFKHQNLEKARILIEEGLKRYPENISLQFSHLVYLNMAGDHEALYEATRDFDLTFLEVPSEHNFGAMHFLWEHGRREDVQDILVRWFVTDPDSHARIVSQFCLNSLTENVRAAPPVIRLASGSCRCGVVCEVNGEVMTRIICSQQDAVHSVLLSENSPVGKEMLKMQPGDESFLHMRKIRLIEKIPVYVAVFRLSAELRNKAFSGDDIFCSLSLPAAAEDIPAFLLDHLPPPQFDHDLLGNVSMPLALRAYRNQPGDPFGACVQALTDERFARASLYDIGIVESDSLVTDLITVIYLAMTSLTDYFVKKNITLCVTPYTLRLVDEWIECVGRGEFRKLGVTEDRRISLLNAEKVINDQSGIYQNLINLRSVMTAIAPVTGDLPWVFCLLRDVLHPVSFSEYYAISAGSPPYFTIDSFSAGYVRYACGDVVFNARDLLVKAAHELPYDTRESGIVLHISSSLPLPLILSDVENLASSPRFAGPACLCRFLGMLTPGLPAHVNVYEFLVSVYMHYVLKIARQGIFACGADPFSTAEAFPFAAGLDRVMYACCNYLLRVPASYSAEDKLVELTCTFLSRCGDTDLFVRKFWPYIQLFMQGRFMSSAVVVERINSTWRDVQRCIDQDK
ncbi:hypothetical protein ABEI22_22220 [Erwinia billingiae]|uniref:hypothetical protein n=1 Tax=Erwinia billingiae TaxID=182337 RepID=UPI00320A8BA8